MSDSTLNNDLKLKENDNLSGSMETECVNTVNELCQSEVHMKMEADEDEVKSAGHRLTSIIDQLRCQSKLKGMPHVRRFLI